MASVNMVTALNMALHQEMARDKNVVVLGEDVGIDGGVFRVTEGLKDKFPERVLDTPLAEGAIAGVSVGMAAYGMKPVAEIQFDGFTPPAFDQLFNHAARLRNRTRGRFTAAMVVRFPYGGGVKALEHHSDSPESYFIHTPGLKVVVPSSPYDAKGLLASAIRDPDPVIFMEPKRVYRAIKEDVPEEEYTVPIGKANVIQEGSDVTLIAYGAMVRECKKAMENIKQSVELIDLRTLNPLDFDAIKKSVQKTGRAVVVHEAQRTLGFAAEISAMIGENLLLNLKAPVTRVTGFDVVVPLAQMEDDYYPDARRIAEAIKETMEF
ncbi:MAG: alpha-ketoacid dehydrogenase subunit beta [Candidatus Aenigmarchaeota archaeon]|nr:alpha-ketoacid dehydrogenase subunit beta [Candidatus Aenigmarchaeota archaeon]